MNCNEFSPDNNRAGELYKGKIIVRLFLKTDEKFPKTVHKRVQNFHNPAFGVKLRISFQFFLFRSARNNMRGVASPREQFFLSDIRRVQTGVLRMFRRGLRTQNYDTVDGSLQKNAFMPVRAVENNCQRDSALIRPDAPFCSHFASVRRIRLNRFTRQRRFDHTAVAALPFPLDSLEFVVLSKPHSPDFQEKSSLCPCLKIPVKRTAGGVFLWRGFPLASCTQNVKNASQHFSWRNRLAPLSRLMLIRLVRVALCSRIRDSVLDFFPELIRNCP